MSSYVSTSEAAQILNITARSVRRKVNSLSPNLSKYVRKEGTKILIDIRLVRGNFKTLATEEDRQESPEADEGTGGGPSSGHLEKVIAILEQQLNAKDEQINSLLERNRELNNIIMAKENIALKLEDKVEPLEDVAEPPQTTEQEQPEPTPTPEKQTISLLGGWIKFKI